MREILQIVQLDHLAQRKPRELSGGQQQRVAIARCLVYAPPVILMDEPLGALDKKLREQLQQEIRRIHKQTGVTIIYVTHDQEEALYLSDRICLMSGGKVEQLGTPSELYFNPRNAFVADFLGESNLLDCHASADGIATLANGKSVRVTPRASVAAEARCSLLVRPDRLQFMRAGSQATNELEGTVEEIAFVGDVTRYCVHVDDLRMHVKVPIARSNAGPTLQSKVRIGWEPADSTMLAG